MPWNHGNPGDRTSKFWYAARPCRMQTFSTSFIICHGILGERSGPTPSFCWGTSRILEAGPWGLCCTWATKDPALGFVCRHFNKYLWLSDQLQGAKIDTWRENEPDCVDIYRAKWLSWLWGRTGTRDLVAFYIINVMDYETVKQWTVVVWKVLF